MTERAGVLRWLAVAAAIAAGCEIDRRSTAFECDGETECGAGRACQQGWCVEIGGVIDAALIDADPLAPDADPNFVCPPNCTRCEIDQTCVITCDAAGSCATPVVCPTGIKCKVECNGNSSCMAGIDCSAASSCVIECTNTDACAGLVTCGSGRCRVECGGQGTCAGGVDCSQACSCDTFCTGASSCAIPHTCPFAGQCNPAPVCTSVQGPCNDC